MRGSGKAGIIKRLKFQEPVMQKRQRAHPRSITAAVVLFATLLMATPAVAADNDADNRTPAPSPTAGQDAEPKCVHGCQRWGKVCNVDPRGVYKCRRTCEKFGEICE